MEQLAKPWVANAPAPVAATTVYFDPGQPNAQAAAQLLRIRLDPKAAVRATTKSIRRHADHAGRPLLIVVLGSSFRGSGSTALFGDSQPLWRHSGTLAQSRRQPPE